MNSKGFKRIISGLAVVGMLFLTTLQAQATFRGDEVTVGHSFNGTTYAKPPDISGPESIKVLGLSTVTLAPANNPRDLYRVTAAPETILITSQTGQGEYSDTPGGFNGPLITDMDWLPTPRRLTGVKVFSSFGIDPSRVGFGHNADGNWVNIDLSGYCSAVGCSSSPLGNLGPFDWVEIELEVSGPDNTVPGPQGVIEDRPLTIDGISVKDEDVTVSTVKLSVRNGTVTVAFTGTASISGGANGTSTLTLAGSEADLNATLATLVYQGTLNYAGPDTLTVTTTATDGATDVDTVAITVTPENDFPVNTVPGAQVVAEDTALALGGLSVADVEGIRSVQLEVENGTVTVTLQGDTSISGGANGTSRLTLAGSEADLNATLATLVYQGTLNYAGPDTLTVTTTDTDGATDVDTVAITVTPVPDFSFYKFKPQKGIVCFFFGKSKKNEITLADQFDTKGEVHHVLLKNPLAIGNPANRGDESDTHLVAYKISPNFLKQFKSEKKIQNIFQWFAKPPKVTVTNQFGQMTAQLWNHPTRLLVPSAKSLDAPVEPLEDPTSDPFQCYEIRKAVGFEKQTVTVTDQFVEDGKTIDLIKPASVCNPTAINGKEPINPLNSLVCYQVDSHEIWRRPRTDSGLDVYTNNQFGPQEGQALQHTEYCVPSLVALPPSEMETSK